LKIPVFHRGEAFNVQSWTARPIERRNLRAKTGLLNNSQSKHTLRQGRGTSENGNAIGPMQEKKKKQRKGEKREKMQNGGGEKKNSPQYSEGMAKG